MLCTLGDLVDDVVVWLEAPIAPDTDTPSRVFHRRGGSAANVAAFAARAGHPVRFVGQVGDDLTGERLVAQLEAEGVDVQVRRAGRTGTVVVLVHPGGERTMLADRGCATELADVPVAWLEGIGVLHLTAYSLTVEPVASAARRAAETVQGSGGLVSVDASSVSVLTDFGINRFLELLAELAPGILLANEDEAEVLRLGPNTPYPAGVGTVVVKHGAEPALVLRPGAAPVEVAAQPMAAGAVADTTGAGDAFAAGFLGALLGGADPVAAAAAGHRLAAAVLGQPGASLGMPGSSISQPSASPGREVR